MAYFDTIEDVKRLRDSLKTEKPAIEQWRKIRDRANDDVLESFKSILPQRVQSVYVPYQPQEPDQEVQDRKAIMASNSGVVEVILKTNDGGLKAKAQKLEDWLDAAVNELFTPEFSDLEIDGLLGDGETIIRLDRLPPGPRIADYAERDELQRYADSDEDDDEDDTPRRRYRNAYRGYSEKGVERDEAHDRAYADVTREAEMQDGLRVRATVVDKLVFDRWEDDQGNIIIGMEYGEVPLNPCLRDLQDYGVAKVENRLVVTHDGEETEIPAVGADVMPVDPVASGSVMLGDRDTVMWTQIRTLDETVILVEGLKADGSVSDDGIMIKLENPWGGRTTGYYSIAGDRKLRADPGSKYQPVILGTLVEGQMISIVASAMLAIAMAEASREETQIVEDQPGRVRAFDATQETKLQRNEDGRPRPMVAGEVQLTPTRDFDLAKLYELFNAQMERYRSREFFAGSGKADETGIHLARLQTAYALKLQPYQNKRARVRKRILEDIVHLAIVEGRSQWVSRRLKGARKPDEGVRVAEPLELTPEMARLAVEISYSIGTETPESQYAAAQMSRQEVAFGTYGMTKHRQIAGVEDPEFEEIQMAIDNVVSQAIGTVPEPGWLVRTVNETIQAVAEEYIRSLFPQPVEEPVGDEAMMGDELAPVEPPVGGQPSNIRPPVQVAEGGVPVASGVEGMRQ